MSAQNDVKPAEGKTLIAEDVEIVGTIKCASGITIDGKLNGDLNCAGDALIGKSASIKGNLAVTSVVVTGQIHGNVVARDRIELKSTARVFGDIKAKRLAVEDGVTFVGKSEVNPSGAPVAAPVAGEEAAEPAGAAGDEARARGGAIFTRK